MTKRAYPHTVHLSRDFAVAPEPERPLFCRAKRKSYHNGSTSIRVLVGNVLFKISACGSGLVRPARNREWRRPILAPRGDLHDQPDRAGDRTVSVAQRRRHADPRRGDALPSRSRRPPRSGGGVCLRRDPATRARVACSRPGARNAGARVAIDRVAQAARTGSLRALRLEPNHESDGALPTVLPTARGAS